MNTEINNTVNAVGDNAQYDNCAKRMLSQKIILAHILVKTVNEFKEMKPEDVVKYIEGEPIIGVVPIDPGLTNTERMNENGQRIVGLNTENSEINEGLIRFDILFYVRMRNGLSKIIINIEAQRNEPTKYKILNRAIFYVSRLISSQKERDFVNSNYDDIKQVFTIWICMNMENNSLSHFHLTKEDIIESYDWKGNLDLVNIVMIGITNKIPEYDEKYELHRLITALLSSELDNQEKLTILEDEYNVPKIEYFREEMNIMCNLSEGIEEKGIAKGIEKGIKEGIAKGIVQGKVEGKVELYYNEMHLSEKEISERLGIKENEVKAIIAGIVDSALSEASKENDNRDSGTIITDRLSSFTNV